MTISDDLGADVPLPFLADGRRPRVVSLVPSLTETVASLDPQLLVGATDWCTHPGDLEVTRVRGTKNPDTAAIVALSPDLVLANKEENRALDVERLRAAGVSVWVTDIRTVDAALRSLTRVVTEALGRPVPPWLRTAQALWGDAAPDAMPTPHRTRAAVAVWRDPWMVVGPDTFTADLLARCGTSVVAPAGDERYPHTTPEAVAASAPDVVLLPSEPYPFTADDGPEAFPGVEARLVDGRLLTWYGPSMLEAAAAFGRPGPLSPAEDGGS